MRTDPMSLALSGKICGLEHELLVQDFRAAHRAFALQIRFYV